jgi:ribosomal protein S12 methylthiotransferase
VDSEGLAGLIVAGGHAVVQDAEAADVVVVNTCGFIDPARQETIEEVLELVDLKRAGAASGLILTGCLVARSADELAEALPEVDAFVDFAAYPQIAGLVRQVADGSLGEKVHGRPGTRFDPAWWDASLAGGPRIRFGRTPWAYLKIAEGCDRGCTFCAIPLMRGKLRSRSAGTIEDEARHLVGQGVTELSLVSQDSVMWGRDTGEGHLVSLLSRLERVEGLRRIRLMYLHPQGVNEELIETIASSEVITSYFDLSMQHVSPHVLRAMGRWGGRSRFEAMMERIRAADSLAAVRSTFILGFPGETDQDASEVESFVADADLDWVAVFTYSREEGTAAHDLAGQVPEEVARERTERVAMAAEITMERRARALQGHTLEVLVERFDLEDQHWIGRSTREAPEVDGEIRFTSRTSLRVGAYIPVLITGNEGADLKGERAEVAMSLASDATSRSSSNPPPSVPCL